jgi:hypothetical protein
MIIIIICILLMQHFRAQPAQYPTFSTTLDEVPPDFRHMTNKAWSFYCFFKALAILLLARLYSMARFLAAVD